MASTISKPVSVKPLGELLQEQQEPFVLELYLLERGYVKKSQNSEGSFGCRSGTSSPSLKRSASCGPNNRRKGIRNWSQLVRAAFNKLVSINENLRTKHTIDGDGKFSINEMGGSSEVVAESDRFSTASSTTVFNSCSESDTEDTSTSSQKVYISSSVDTFQALELRNIREKEAATDRKLRWRCPGDSKQLSPVSVLEGIASDEGSPVHNMRHYARTRQQENPSISNLILSNKVTDNSILSASLWELLVDSPIEKPSCSGAVELQELVGSNPLSQYSKSKRVLQQTKQLLFDCVREVVETHGRKERRQQHFQQFQLGSEELGKLICENIRSWNKQSGDETNITQLLNVDFMASAEEWSDIETQTREIGIEIGDALLEEVRNEIVTDIIDFFGT